MDTQQPHFTDKLTDKMEIICSRSRNYEVMEPRIKSDFAPKLFSFNHYIILNYE